jgi:hypothetical protein
MRVECGTCAREGLAAPMRAVRRVRRQRSDAAIAPPPILSLRPTPPRGLQEPIRPQALSRVMRKPPASQRRSQPSRDWTLGFPPSDVREADRFVQRRRRSLFPLVFRTPSCGCLPGHEPRANFHSSESLVRGASSRRRRPGAGRWDRRVSRLAPSSNPRSLRIRAGAEGSPKRRPCRAYDGDRAMV